MAHKREQFIEVLRDHRKILFKIINAYCRDKDDQQDLEQEILIQIWNAMDRFDGRSKLSTWIYRIALNVSISHFRKDHRRKEGQVSMDESVLELVDDVNLNPDLEAQVDFLYCCIRELDGLNKALVILYLEGKSYREIAEILGITESNTGTKIARVKKIFKEKFKQNSYGKI